MRGDNTTAGAGPWCRRCTLPARVEGDPEFGRAVHAATGEELGPCGDRCAPVSLWLPSMDAVAALGKVAALGFP